MGLNITASKEQNGRQLYQIEWEDITWQNDPKWRDCWYDMNDAAAPKYRLTTRARAANDDPDIKVEPTEDDDDMPELGSGKENPFGTFAFAGTAATISSLARR